MDRTPRNLFRLHQQLHKLFSSTTLTQTSLLTFDLPSLSAILCKGLLSLTFLAKRIISRILGDFRLDVFPSRFARHFFRFQQLEKLRSRFLRRERFVKRDLPPSFSWVSPLLLLFLHRCLTSNFSVRSRSGLGEEASNNALASRMFLYLGLLPHRLTCHFVRIARLTVLRVMHDPITHEFLLRFCHQSFRAFSYVLCLVTEL